MALLYYLGSLRSKLTFSEPTSPESGLSPSPEELIYRFMKMFETGEGHVGRKFPVQELHPQIQRGWLSTHWEVAAKIKCMGVEWGVVGPGLCPWAVGFCTRKMPEVLRPVPVPQRKMHKAVLTSCAASCGSEDA